MSGVLDFEEPDFDFVEEFGDGNGDHPYYYGPADTIDETDPDYWEKVYPRLGNPDGGAEQIGTIGDQASGITTAIGFQDPLSDQPLPSSAIGIQPPWTESPQAHTTPFYQQWSS